jgi:hypothetical protein
LPLVPLGVVGATPIPTINQAVGDQVGWPELAATVDRVGRTAGPGTIVLATNYGEAGAIARYSTRFADRVWSGHNGLGQLPPPSTEPRQVVMVGDEAGFLARFFASCRTLAHIDDGVGVDNEEQGEPVALCRDARAPIAVILHASAHLD